MGSEHYCLRWNNHQSNLLGVFSQLLQDESLVDVTLACAEGHSIRAHKVVLSACSSYFQTLFIDHPNRHPIVILKDVCFAELRTLVEFMYKGEVNVEYCQLSALLKTAESLKVKGLAEMTNLSSTTTTIKREKDDRVDRVEGVQQQASGSSCSSEMPSAPDVTGNKRLTNDDTNSPSPVGGRNGSPGPPPTKRGRGGDCEDGTSDCERERVGSPNRESCPGPTDMSASGMAMSQLPQCSSRLSSPHLSEMFPGPSGLPPVQQVPLSLKKEIEWDREDNKSTAGESSSDYRHPHESDLSPCETDGDDKYGLIRRQSDSSRPTTPFQFPFPTFSGFADTPGGETSTRPNCSLLTFLQQQGFLPSPVSDDSLGRTSIGPSSPYRCVICLAAFPSSWLLEQHNSLQHSTNSRNSETGSPGEDKPFKCDQCGQNYRYRSAYLKHQEQNHRARLPADKLFTCDVCGMQFRYLKSFKKHRLNHALEKLHSKSPQDMELFSRNRHNGKTLPESSTDLNSKMLSVLGPKVNGTIQPRESGRVTAPPSSSADSGSDQVSSSNEALGNISSSTYIDRASSVPISKTEQQNFYKFSLDDYYYYNSGRTAAGTDANKGVKTDRICDSEQDETIDSLAYAISMSANSEAFRLQQETSLMNLLRYETPDNRQQQQQQREHRFSCPFCGKCVRSKENLKLHIRKHTGERPFVCLFCGRAFGGKSDLTRHLRIHTGERPYHCEMCGKCFARADYLSKHLTTHIHTHNSHTHAASARAQNHAASARTHNHR